MEKKYSWLFFLSLSNVLFELVFFNNFSATSSKLCYFKFLVIALSLFRKKINLSVNVVIWFFSKKGYIT